MFEKNLKKITNIKIIQMKQLILISILLIAISSSTKAQREFKLGIGYFGDNVILPGALLQFEYEKYASESFSMPIQANLVYHAHPDFHSFMIDINKGFRKYFNNDYFIEQSLGIGVAAKNFHEQSYWYMDQREAVYIHGNKTVFGLMPSVTLGLGYDLSKAKDHSSLLWVRPKIFWDLGYRPLHLPNAALQIGYSLTLKSI